jgi:peroxiredoxin Q/BCP
MPARWLVSIGTVSAILAVSACGLAAKAALAPGDSAPPFDLPGSDGKAHRLADDLGKRAVVIAWFPKAFTGG